MIRISATCHDPSKVAVRSTCLMSEMAKAKDRSIATLLHPRGLSNRGFQDFVRNAAVASIQTIKVRGAYGHLPSIPTRPGPWSGPPRLTRKQARFAGPRASAGLYTGDTTTSPTNPQVLCVGIYDPDLPRCQRA